MKPLAVRRTSTVAAVVGALVWLLLGLAAPPAPVLGVQPASKLLAFGLNTYGQLGDGTTTPRPAPVEIAGMTDIVAIDAGFDHSLALRSDGRVYAWGLNSHGQLGEGTHTNRLVPTLVPGLTYVTAIGAGGDFSVAIRSDGSVWQWGARTTLGASADLPDLLVPTQALAGSPSLIGGSLSAGAGHRLVVVPTGVLAWGDNASGQLSNGNTTANWTPANFFNPWGGGQQAEGGYGHSVIRLYDGTLRTIGRNDNGQLGDASFVERHTLVQPAIANVAEIAAGDLHTLARTGDGKVWSWGDNAAGELGNGGTTDSATPTAVPSLSGVTAVGAGGSSSMAINASGAWYWGGDAATPVKTPVLILNTAGASDVTGGGAHSLVLMNAAALHLPASSPTSLTITSSPDPAFVGEPVTLTFTVSPAPDMGTISRAPDAVGPFTPIATIDPLTGKATIDRTYLFGGTYPAWYRFDGVPGFDQSAVVYFEQPIVQHVTTTSATPTSATIGRGDPLTVTSTVSPVPDGGFARLSDGGIPVTGNAAVDPLTGVATFSINSLGVGHHDLSVEYAGTDRFTSSTSSTLDITVFDRPTTTSASLTPDPSLWGESVDVDVRVSPIPDDGGGVRISRDGHTLGWATMDWTLGTGTFALDAIEPGSHSVLTEFVPSGSVPRWAASSATVPQTVSSTPIDTDPPIGTVSIDGGAEFTTGYVVVTMHATDASRLTAAISCDGANWQPSPTVDGDLGWGFGNPSCDPNEGLKTIYIRWTDAYGNTTVATDSIILDFTPPKGTLLIADGAASVDSPTVVVDVAASDPVSGLGGVALSNDGTTWTARAYAALQPWTLTPGDGIKTVFVKWSDLAGNLSNPVSQSIVLTTAATDTVAPTATAPTTMFVAGSTVSTGPTMSFTWSGADAGSGIGHYDFGLSIDGGAYATISSSLASPNLTRALAAGHTYRARVRATDVAGNVGAWVYGVSFKLTGYQESSRSIHWTGTWHTSTSTAYWGGHDRYATAAGAKASLTFTGRSFAWVGSVGPSRGWAKVYVNGVLVKSINLNARANTNRRILFATSWSTAKSRTVTIRISGTAGHPRGDIDALIVGS